RQHVAPCRLPGPADRQLHRGAEPGARAGAPLSRLDGRRQSRRAAEALCRLRPPPPRGQLFRAPARAAPAYPPLRRGQRDAALAPQPPVVEEPAPRVRTPEATLPSAVAVRQREDAR